MNLHQQLVVIDLTNIYVFELAINKTSLMVGSVVVYIYSCHYSQVDRIDLSL